MSQLSSTVQVWLVQHALFQLTSDKAFVRIKELNKSCLCTDVRSQKYRCKMLQFQFSTF